MEASASGFQQCRLAQEQLEDAINAVMKAEQQLRENAREVSAFLPLLLVSLPASLCAGLAGRHAGCYRPLAEDISSSLYRNSAAEKRSDQGGLVYCTAEL